MKNICFSLSIIVSLALSSCQEVGPVINLRDNENVISDTTYIESPVASPDARTVVIEEFTGVRCPNCPQGHDIIEAIKTQHGSRIISVALHPINSLGAPYPYSSQDFRNSKSQSLFDYLVQIGQEPAAGIDRMLFNSETNILLDKNKWANYTNQQVNVPATVNISLDKSYDSTTRELTIIIEAHFTQTDTTEKRLTVMLTESGMIEPQLDGFDVDTFYVHDNVMRDIISNTLGDALPQPHEAGRVIRRVYKTILDAAWKEENMKIVAFVHQFQNTKAVYQGKEIKAVD